MTVTPNQSYLTKQLQYKLAAALAGFLNGVRSNVGFNSPTYDYPEKSLVPPSNWRKDKMVFTFGPGDQYSPQREVLSDPLGPRAFRPELRRQEDHGQRPGQRRRQDQDRPQRNGWASCMSPTREEASLTNSFSSAITKGVTLDVTKSKTDTKDASVDAEQTISGEYAGVSAEAKLSEHFGISQEKSESRSEGHSSELAKEKSEEGTTAEKIAIDFSAKPRSNYLGHHHQGERAHRAAIRHQRHRGFRYRDHARLERRRQARGALPLRQGDAQGH